jgi:hypothetical protein
MILATAPIIIKYGNWARNIKVVGMLVAPCLITKRCGGQSGRNGRMGWKPKRFGGKDLDLSEPMGVHH